ncbi:MAG: Holliday junction resolvase RuvX [Armatimonadota bacterium]
MAVDLGTKRIGIAVSDPDGLFASPLMVISRKGGAQDLREVASLARDYEVGTVVVGLPVNLRGELATAAENMSREIEQLRKLLEVPVETYDERLTSAAANKSMQSGGLGREDRKDKVDKVAAAMLLQSYLDKIRFAHGSSEE